MKPKTLEMIKNLLSMDETVLPEEEMFILDLIGTAKRKPRPGTIEEAAEILGVHTGTIRRYAKAGLLTPIRITSRKVRYDLNAVEELAHSGATDA